MGLSLRNLSELSLSPKGWAWLQREQKLKERFFYNMPYSCLVAHLPAETSQTLDSLYGACFIEEPSHQAKEIKYWTSELPKSLALDPQVMGSA